MIRIFQKGFNYSQDGPGNRLVYHLQGCNLCCPWCSNPEGLAIAGGTEYCIDALVEEVLRSRMMFFDGGGVTLTGGEVTMQLPEVLKFLSRLKIEGIHTCIETNGISAGLAKLFPVLDYLIMDVKHYDSEKHRIVTGMENTATLKNLAAALEAEKKLAIRIPLIGGFNADLEDARKFAALFSELGVPGKATVELLCYHEYGKDKYAKLGIPYNMDETAKVNNVQIKQFECILRETGIEVIHT